MPSPSPPLPPISDLFAAAERTAVHLEARDVYAVAPESEEMATWRATGRRSAPDSPYWRDWVGLVRRTVARGVTVRRARIVSEPVSEYVRFEHAGTPANLAAGEDVRWLPRDHAADLALPDADFWLFDERLVRFGYFDGDGHLTGHDVTDDPAVAALCAQAFEAVWSRATPHEKYEI
ncbi:hypothetical protein RM780_19180 [Streptomyces sp. DSM 44917]|uniref:DUF6879 domain-containing protein n=1 Tax=Streptomyces boetiae TaxID=3075541 RepID=A0ABU2LCP4_9ACTN|nr:DUF6879 family protein [Streptomyces sp. DSM 44917]MDT0309067.1 hypothetical protein [Streptomyces sp. DSM 44917]